MGANLPELSLNLSPVHQVPKTISEFLKEISAINDFCERSSKLNEYVHMLEDELRKIHGYKCEVPLCMILLKDAIERLEEEKMQGKETEVWHGNLNEDGGEKMSSDCIEKKDWLSSAKLWSANINCEKDDIKKQESGLDLKSREKGEDGSAIKNRSTFRSREGAFVPFKGRSSPAMKEERKVLAVDDGPSLSTPVAERGFIDLNLDFNNETSCVWSMVADQTKQAESTKHQQHKKQRRCWTPELHRRFIDAIQQLGGEKATPKHIRALMQVDGLTGDEVKSHLQKYRLHVRKIQNCSEATQSYGLLRLGLNGYQQVVSKENVAHSSSPQGPLHLKGSGKGVSITGGNSKESEEDEKSESHSWKCLSASQAL